VSQRRFALLFAAGLALRLPGLWFNGIGDLYQILLEWGASVHRYGLVDAFAINYGIFSYALFGIAAWGADLIPRFWWAPYKIIILAFDIAVLFALCRIAPRDKRTAVAAMYWVNPWFILHEAYHAFWEGPHILLGLLAVLAARHIRQSVWRWVAAGALLACSAMFKPQGLLHFLAPLGLYLAVQGLFGVSQPFVWFTSGAVAVVVAISLAIVAAGGSVLALFENYRSAMTVMAGISNGGPGIWRFVAFVYMVMTGQQQAIPFVKMPRMLIAGLSACAAMLTLAMEVAYAVRIRLREADSAERGIIVLAVLAFGSLVMSQFGVRAHINHSYGAMVVLIPLAVSHERLRTLWMGMCALLGISHALVFGLGHAALLPPENLFDRYPAASGLIARVRVLPAYIVPDWPLRLQGSVQDTIAAWPAETIVSLLSVAVFVLACLVARELFTVVSSDRR
jgi:hypothetical protein